MGAVNFFAVQLDHSASHIDPAQVVDELTYLNYAHNRRRNPLVTPERWRFVFGNRVDLMEQRYQVELAQEEQATAAAQWLNNGPGYGEE